MVVSDLFLDSLKNLNNSLTIFLTHPLKNHQAQRE